MINGICENDKGGYDMGIKNMNNFGYFIKSNKKCVNLREIHFNLFLRMKLFLFEIYLKILLRNIDKYNIEP